MEQSVGISLGWNCGATMRGLANKFRVRRLFGYTTSVFDIMVSNYPGLLLCLYEDFKYFTDPAFITLIDISGEMIIHNTRYKFNFNHESPGHADLYIDEKWAEGNTHFTNNNYRNFIYRYNIRIQNFRNYLKSGIKINFLMTRPQREFSQLIECLRITYPNLNYKIIHLFYMEEDTLDFFIKCHREMGLLESDAEIVSAKALYEHPELQPVYSDPVLRILFPKLDID